MKNFSIRLSVLALAFTGFSASTVASYAGSHKSVTPTAVAMGTTPAALCPINNPGPCHLD